MHNYPTVTGCKIRLALIGCGRIANSHFGAIEGHADNVELVDVCDVNSTALAQAVARSKATGHSNLADLLKTTTADLVVLTTPSGLQPRANHSNCCVWPPRHGRKTHGHPLARRRAHGQSM